MIDLAIANPALGQGRAVNELAQQALEKAKLAKEAHGEIETDHPGYLDSQDTY